MYVKYEIWLTDCKMSLVLFIMEVIFVCSYFFKLKKFLHHFIWYLFSFFFSSRITSNQNPRKKRKSQEALAFQRSWISQFRLRAWRTSKPCIQFFPNMCKSRGVFYYFGNFLQFWLRPWGSREDLIINFTIPLILSFYPKFISKQFAMYVLL